MSDLVTLMVVLLPLMVVVPSFFVTALGCSRAAIVGSTNSCSVFLVFLWS